MKILILAPSIYSIPPQTYGGTEQVISDLADGLVKKGHQVTLSASGDSKTKAKLEYIFSKSLIENPKFKMSDRAIYLTLQAAHVLQKANNFDLIHNHIEEHGLIFTPFIKTPMVTTHHGRFLETASLVYSHFRKQNFIAISNAQKSWLPQLNWVSVVYHGLKIEDYSFQEKPGDYLLFIGKVCPEKGTHYAIEIAKKSGCSLVITGLAPLEDPCLKKYFEEKIKPHIDGKKIKFLGTVSKEKKISLFQKAKALLFPIDWEEAFGLVMIEAMACGTPVIAFNKASVPEIVKDEKTGFIVKVKDVDGMARAVGKIDQIDRKACRRHVEENFTIEKMVEGYEKVYKKVIKK